jgi:hypothetical protein
VNTNFTERTRSGNFNLQCNETVPHYHTDMLNSLGFTQPLTEMITRNIKIIMFLGSRARLVRKADNFTTICEPIV